MSRHSVRYRDHDVYAGWDRATGSYFMQVYAPCCGQECDVCTEDVPVLDVGAMPDERIRSLKELYAAAGPWAFALGSVASRLQSDKDRNAGNETDDYGDAA